MWFCLQILNHLQQALDGVSQVMVWYQLTGLQGRAAKSQYLARKHKRKQTQKRQLSKADLYNNITENWTPNQSA